MDKQQVEHPFASERFDSEMIPRARNAINNSLVADVVQNTNHDSKTVELSYSMTIYLLVMFACVCQSIDMFGIVTNIVNVICFVKQGFKDPVNISLLGLAISDLGCLLTLIWTNICYTPAFASKDLPFDATEFQYLTSGMPHTTFARVTGWITAVITLERCLCITAPLKVRNIVTPRRVSFLIVSIFLILILSVAPLYVVNRLGMKYFPARNKTLIGLVFTADRVNVEKISFTINNIIIPFTAFFIITLCTIILVIKLHNITKWRKTSTAPAQADTVSNRNQKAAKMVVLISSLFIACFIPVSMMFVTAMFVPEFAIDGEHKNIVIVYSGVGFVLESINSSINIFIYYYMSSKYRHSFRHTFCLDTKSR